MKLLGIGLLFAMTLPAADLLERPSTPKRVWARRITLAAACAASLGFDTLSTRRATSAGAVESNGLLANPQGQPRWGLVIGLKAAACAGSALVEERHSAWQSPRADWTFTGVNAGVAAGYTWVGIHNLNVANELLTKH
jgi:hypothetical protein